MRATRGALGALAVLAIFAISLSVGSAQAATIYVELKNTMFNPQNVNIVAGDTVIWTNNDTFAHDVTFEGGFGSGAMGSMAAGATYSHTFDTNGTFRYRCQMHTAAGVFTQGMVGSVQVGTTTAPPPPPSTPGFEGLGAALAILAALGVVSARRARR